MKKVKLVCIIILILFFVYGIYIGIELKRFETKIGTKPLIVIGNIDSNVKVGSDITKEKIKGIGFTVEYELKYIKTSDDLINAHVISGKLKLFDKILLGAYIE